MTKKILISMMLVISIITLNIHSVYASDTTVENTTLGDIIEGAQGFIEAGKTEEEKISQENLQKLSNMIYNILLVLGIIIAIILGAILGIKFMTEGVEGQIEVKKALIPYVIGCVVVFGAFTIWKIVVNMLQSM